MLTETVPILLTAIRNFSIFRKHKKWNLCAFDLQGTKIDSEEGKMTNILTNDVQTYVRELIVKEFGSVNKEEKAHSENRKVINSEYQRQQKQRANSATK